MEFLSSALAAIFIALLLGAALTFGFVLLVWFFAIALAVAAFVLLQQWWRRWMFLRAGRMPQDKSSKIIEVEYKDISNHK